MTLSNNHLKLKSLVSEYVPGNSAVPDEFIHHFKEAKAGKEEFIAESGKVCHELVYVVSGLLRMCFTHPNGEIYTTGFFPENTIVTSFFSFNEQKVSGSCIQALEPSQLLVIRYDELLSPASGDVGRLLLDRYGYLEHKRIEEYMTMLYDKDAEARYRWFSTNYPTLKRCVCDQYVGSFLAITRESVVRKKKLVSTCN